MDSDYRLTERPGLGMATIMARKGIQPAVIGAVLGFLPPDGPERAADARLALIGTGPGTWLALAETPEADWVTQLANKLNGLASVSDQSGSYVVLRIAGSGARETLQRGVFIDLHPAVFRSGSAATTVIEHIGVVLWQLDDVPTFEIATFRSFASNIRHWFELAAAS